MTWTWYHLPLILLGLGLVFAPVLGALAARDFRPARCPRCGRELVGSPPEHRPSDRGWCRAIAYAKGDVL